MWDQINQVLIYTKLGIKITTKSIIIIGAGLAGLSTGCYSQMNGYLTHIFEHHTTPGGVAACWDALIILANILTIALPALSS